MKNNTLLSIALFLLASFTIQAQSTEISKEVKENIKSRVENGVSTGIVVGVVTPEGTNYFSYGVKSYESNEPLDENSIFEIGSISKTFTGLLLAEMIVKGEIANDEALQNLLPDGITAPTKDGETIKLFQLSNHTSGLPRLPDNMPMSNLENPYADYTEELMFEFLNNYELTRDIGSEFEYSNYAVGMLGYLLAAKNKMTYEELLMKAITEPLNMENTRILFSPKMKENLAKGHNLGLEVKNWDLPTLAGAGAIRSSALDMTKYLSANMGIVKSDLFPAFQLTHQVTTGEEIEQKVGLGWIINEKDDNTYIWHNGATGGYRAFAGFIQNGNYGVVVLSNSDSPITNLGMHLLDPTMELTSLNPSISVIIKEVFESKGIKKATKVYWDLKKNNATDYDFGEEQLNALGYSYFQKDEIKNAIYVFLLNIEAYPESSNAYDSYAEALMKNSETEKAVKNYKKSFELNPGNTNAIQKLKELGVDTKDMVSEVAIDNAILESYVGEYELVPGFILTITKDGNQLNAQATGQGEASIYPKSENEFYYKIVDAQIVFKMNEAGKVESLTLFQAGQELTGKKIK